MRSCRVGLGWALIRVSWFWIRDLGFGSSEGWDKDEGKFGAAGFGMMAVVIGIRGGRLSPRLSEFGSDTNWLSPKSVIE